MHLIVYPTQVIAIPTTPIPDASPGAVATANVLPLSPFAVVVGGSGKILLKIDDEMAFAADDNLAFIWRS